MNLSSSAGLEEVITDAVNDSLDTSADNVDTSPTVEDTPVVEASPDVTDTVVSGGAIAEEPTESTEVTASGNTTATPSNQPQDEFERLAGVAALGIGGRENRIPYSRVKKITEKAVSEIAEAVLGRKLAVGEKAVDVVKAHVAQLPALQTRVTEYETRLDKVGEFEDVMANQPERFLQILSKIPAYNKFFEFVEQAYNAQANPPVASQPATGAAQPVLADDGMPQPDAPLEDGTSVYSMEGLKQLFAWNAKQVEDRVTKQFTDRYAPIEQDWKHKQYVASTLPVIRAQIAEAQTWPLFKESEAEITKELELDQAITLEAAYRKVVFPKLMADRNKMRQGFIQEIQKAPVAPSIPARVATRPSSPDATTGPRSIEEVIKASLDALKQS